ncbi:cell wall hydrolase [Jiella sonneratiae]|uniref:Cell wall hydrolase n=1 Tax=Jiella sonneratiae TaxID=2816856 RepID=A0ABS3J5Z0_9HYPH|nr:cell wall hydrolase [Jiella sonneratiae]MBO0903986.1 cell wall hydrolase [Jiella sonneratiae]
MSTTHAVIAIRRALLCALALPLAGCVGAPGADEALDAIATRDFGPAQECLARAMYFESNRSSEDGMLAVGTVVMNRVESPDYPNDVCEVVGQPGQFAAGVMTRDMNAGKDLAMKVASRVLSGARHRGVDKAKYFHTAGMHFGYRNMNYTAIAGGNAFYERVSRRLNPGFRMTSQAEVREAQNATGAIDTLRTASTARDKATGSTTAIGYAEPKMREAAMAPVPGERPAEAATATPEPKSPFLGMFRSRKQAGPNAGEGNDGRSARLADAAPDERPAADGASAENLPGVGTGMGFSESGGGKGDGPKDGADAWLRRW